MKELQKALGNRAIAIWSLGNTDHSMNAEQLRVWDYIVEHERIPDEYDYLIINKSAGTAITLRGHIDFIVVNIEDADVVEQVRGRYRDDLDTLYIKDERAIPGIEVPSDYLNRKLNKEERSMLANLLSETISSMIRSRIRSSMQHAKAQGKKLGRRPTTKDDIPPIFYKHYPSYMSGTLNVSELARICGLSRPTVYKYLRLVG